MAKEQALGCHHVGVTRSKNLVHRPDRLGAMHHRCDGLGAADSINLGRSSKIGGEEECRIEGSILATGGADHDLWTPSHLGQSDGHERRGHQRRGAAGNVHPDPLEGLEHFAHLGAVGVLGRPIPAAGALGEGGDVLGRFGHGGPQIRPGHERGLHPFGLSHRNLFRPQGGTVETLGELDQGRVSAGTDRLDDGARAFLNDGVKER